MDFIRREHSGQEDKEWGIVFSMFNGYATTLLSK
jgi:hypothetical protein